MMNSKVETTALMAEPFHVDFSGHLTMGVLGNHLLNCAGVHAASRGFGMAELNESKYTWVLSRLAIEMTEMPYQYEQFTIDTWVESVYRLFTNRNFRICSKDGSPIGYARSIWAMIDMKTRKPADLFQLHGGSIVEYCTDELDCPIERPGRIKVTQTEPVSVFKSKYSDIDINGHVNSIRYIEHIMDLFSLDYLKNHALKRFEMAYSAESYYGDELRIYQEETNRDSFDLEIRRMVGEKEEVCVKSKIFFK